MALKRGGAHFKSSLAGHIYVFYVHALRHVHVDGGGGGGEIHMVYFNRFLCVGRI